MTCGDGNVGEAMLRGGATALGDSRHLNLWNLRRVGIRAPLWLLRSAEPELARETVRAADVSLNCEWDTIKALDSASASDGDVHRVVIMVDVGDLREGVLPDELFPLLRKVKELRHVRVEGVGTNLTCYGTVIPTSENLSELVGLARGAEEIVGHELLVSGGNSSSLPLALAGRMPEGVDNLHIGESILLGMDTLSREPLVRSLRLDAFIVRAPVVECRVKPSMPGGCWAPGTLGATSLSSRTGENAGGAAAIGRQDARPEGLRPLDPRVEVLGASSDHLILDVEALGGRQDLARSSRSCLTTLRLCSSSRRRTSTKYSLRRPDARIVARKDLQLARGRQEGRRHPPSHALRRPGAASVQRFATMTTWTTRCTIEEREEYEPHIDGRIVVFAGVDYEPILRQAETGGRRILWDGGNNDLPFFTPDLQIVVADPHRAGHEMRFFPGEANLPGRRHRHHQARDRRF